MVPRIVVSDSEEEDEETQFNGHEVAPWTFLLQE
jgi:hypothetical protein